MLKSASTGASSNSWPDERCRQSCRICLQTLPNSPSGHRRLLDVPPPPSADTSRSSIMSWSHFVLDTMALRVPSAVVAGMPQHVCDACARSMRSAYDLFRQARDSTAELVRAHEQREQSAARMSRNGDGAAGVRPSGRKIYFENAGAGASDDVEAETAAVVKLMEQMEKEATEAGDESGGVDDGAGAEETTTTMFGEDDFDELVGAMDDDGKPAETAAETPAGGPSADGTVWTVRRDDVLQSMAAQRQRPEASNFEKNRLQDDNLGFRMLQRNGWQPGQSCGRNSDGIAEPIAVALKTDRRCLGETGASASDQFITHTIMFSFVRQLMMQNGQIERLVFGADFSPNELRVLRGVGGRMQMSVQFTDDGCFMDPKRKSYQYRGGPKRQRW